LNREQAVYDANLPRWVQEHDCAHVLIKDDDVIGFYPTREEALFALINSPPAGTLRVRRPGSSSAFTRVNVRP